MDCPRCGLPDVTAPACPRCGVIFAKLGASRPRPSLPAPPSRPAPANQGGSSGRLWLVLGAIALGALAALATRSRAPLPAAGRPKAEVAPSSRVEPRVEAPLPPPTLPSASRAPDAVRIVEAGLLEADRATADALVHRVDRREPVSDADVRSAEDLHERHPDEAGLRDLLSAVRVLAGTQEQGRRRFADAAAHLRRAIEVAPQNGPARAGLIKLLIETEDWTGAEAAARELLALEPRDAGALESLAYVLFRQDRNREAADVLKEALDIRPTEFARSLLERIEKGMADEKGMIEQRLSHFNVRYDGSAHEDVGREILRALERHYVTLASTLDHQPAATIPVILFSREAYYDASGAPSWSGGVYDNTDGRIRVPIGGLTPSLTPDMDQTLIHEVTHAFIADRTRGAAPRDVHEGLAQFMEGRRTASALSEEEMRALADGRIPGVAGFYLSALSFVEYLMATRGQGGMNDLLRVMGETGKVDDAFSQAYGQDYRATRKAWNDRLRQQHGS